MKMIDLCEEKADGFGSDKLIIRKGWPLIRQSLFFLLSSSGAGSSRLPGQRVGGTRTRRQRQPTHFHK